MKHLCLVAMAAMMIGTAGAAVAASKKEKECGYQADIVKAVQLARLNRVREKKVTEVVLAGEVTWPERYNPTIAIFAGEMYKLKIRELEGTNQGAEWRKLCLAN